MNDVLDPLKNPVTYAVPFFLLTILIELAALKWLDHDDDVTGYHAKDAGTSMLMGLGSLVSTLVFKVGAFVVYSAVFVYVAPFHLAMDTWWSWALAVVAVDFVYYFSHRFVHRVNVGWAAHQAHHSSEYMNFATALRQKWNPWFEFFFFLPLPFLGIAPWAIYMAFGFNLIYQFFTHTELVGKLWRPVELVMNTPSHHRVHHGSDPEYLDKNYAGILIVWDRMFGTFQPELDAEPCRYGIVKNLGSFNVLRVAFHEWIGLAADLFRSRSPREAIGYLFGPPGWSPDGSRETSAMIKARWRATQAGAG